MQDNKVYMLTVKKLVTSVSWVHIVFARGVCVDIKLSMSCCILTLACGSVSWKSFKIILMTLVIMKNQFSMRVTKNSKDVAKTIDNFLYMKDKIHD